MQLNFNWELGRLLVYIADVATAIRMNSPYNGAYQDRDPRDIGLDVMWLSDSLHCLDRLGRAIQSGEPEQIVEACDSLLHYYRMFTDGVPEGARMKGDPKATADRHERYFRVGEAMATVMEIRNKAATATTT